LAACLVGRPSQHAAVACLGPAALGEEALQHLPRVKPWLVQLLLLLHHGAPVLLLLLLVVVVVP
jgi:hypothetical protein